MQQPVPASPDKDTLKHEIGQLDNRIQETRQLAVEELRHQQTAFEGVAQAFQAEARDVTSVEVANAETKLQTRLRSEYENRIRVERSRLQGEMRDQAQSIEAGAVEAAEQRERIIIDEARSALDSQRRSLEVVSLESHNETARLQPHWSQAEEQCFVLNEELSAALQHGTVSHVHIARLESEFQRITACCRIRRQARLIITRRRSSSCRQKWPKLV